MNARWFRNQRALSKAGREKTQTHIPEFFESVTKVMEDNDVTRTAIMNVCGNDKNKGCVAPILKKLYDNVVQNANAKSKFANRHDETITNFAASLYCLVGRGGRRCCSRKDGLLLCSAFCIQKFEDLKSTFENEKLK